MQHQKWPTYRRRRCKKTFNADGKYQVQLSGSLQFKTCSPASCKNEGDVPEMPTFCLVPLTGLDG
jgi:hypothetical protein